MSKNTNRSFTSKSGGIVDFDMFCPISSPATLESDHETYSDVDSETYSDVDSEVVGEDFWKHWSLEVDLMICKLQVARMEKLEEKIKNDWTKFNVLLFHGWGLPVVKQIKARKPIKQPTKQPTQPKYLPFSFFPLSCTKVKESNLRCLTSNFVK